MTQRLQVFLVVRAAVLPAPDVIHIGGWHQLPAVNSCRKADTPGVIIQEFLALHLPLLSVTSGMCITSDLLRFALVIYAVGT